jgi:DNA-binding response OmpR family regulator
MMALGSLLVLDDDTAVGTVLMFAARSAGFEAELCETPQAFFDTLRSWAPTHVAIDLQLGGTDGLQVLRRLAEGTARPLVIIISGAGDATLQAALQQAQDLGLPTAGVLNKPFSLAALRSLLADNPAPR